MSSNIRVLHSVGVFLRITENWIYPQITRVPGVASAVLCKQVLNLPEFPLNGRPLWKREILPRNPAHPKPLRAVRRITNWPVNAAALSQARLWKPAIIHAHFGTVGWQDRRLRSTLGAPLVTSFYGYDAWQLPTTFPKWRRRLAQLFARGDMFLVEGSAFRQRLLDLGCVPEKVQIQRLGVDLSRLEYRQRDFTGTLKIAMVGRFIEKKGLADGLAACAKASMSGTSLYVTIIGDALPEDPVGQKIKRALSAISQSAEMPNRIHFKGSVSHEETLKVLATHDIFLCPSKHSGNGDAEGGLPVVLLEAMALGLLCLGSRHCDIPEAIIDERTGYSFEEGDVEQLATLIRKIARVPETASPITAAARKHVEENYDQSHQLAALGRVYKEIVAVTRQS
jgi:colanic acid/amylovoran biosynthesis glycosyltransferase